MAISACGNRTGAGPRFTRARYVWPVVILRSLCFLLFLAHRAPPGIRVMNIPGFTSVRPPGILRGLINSSGEVLYAPFPDCRPRCIGLSLAILGLPDGARSAVGGDFRIDNATYFSDEKAPPLESITIFHDGVVYDCMKNPNETVVFDPAGGRFVLLNLKSQPRVDHRRIGGVYRSLAACGRQNSDPVVKMSPRRSSTNSSMRPAVN